MISWYISYILQKNVSVKVLVWAKHSAGNVNSADIQKCSSQAAYVLTDLNSYSPNYTECGPLKFVYDANDLQDDFLCSDDSLLKKDTQQCCKFILCSLVNSLKGQNICGI